MKAQQLSSYTILVTSNKKTFPVEFDLTLTSKLVDTSIEIYAKAWEANNIRVNDSHDKWTLRKTLQEESMRNCDRMLVLLGIAKGVLHLRDKRIVYWSDRILEVKAMLSAWHKTDVDRYGHL